MHAVEQLLLIEHSCCSHGIVAWWDVREIKTAWMNLCPLQLRRCPASFWTRTLTWPDARRFWERQLFWLMLLTRLQRTNEPMSGLFLRSLHLCWRFRSKFWISCGFIARTKSCGCVLIAGLGVCWSGRKNQEVSDSTSQSRVRVVCSQKFWNWKNCGAILLNAASKQPGWREAQVKGIWRWNHVGYSEEVH